VWVRCNIDTNKFLNETINAEKVPEAPPNKFSMKFLPIVIGWQSTK
jgi:hypothetical protein